MNTIQGIPRHQMQFTSMDDFITADNQVRIIDAFVEKLDLGKQGISHHNVIKSHADDKTALQHIGTFAGTLINYLAMRRVNTRGMGQTNKCMLMASVAYNLKKLLKWKETKVQTAVMAFKKSKKSLCFYFLAKRQLVAGPFINTEMFSVE